MPELPRTNEGKRICQVIKVKPEALEEYKKVSHAHRRTLCIGAPGRPFRFPLALAD